MITTTKNKIDNEKQIRQLLDDYIKAFRSRDLDAIMSFYAPEMVSYDIVPPLQDVGKQLYRKVWENAFGKFQGPVDVEIRDLTITTGDDVAFSHTLYRIATKMNGEKVDYWERLTFGLRKIESTWLITHVHVSVPVDLKGGQAVRNLKP